MMSSTLIAIPVNLEQIAQAVQSMSPIDQVRLLDLVPELRQRARQPAPQPLIAQLVEWPPEFDGLRAQMMAILGNQPLRSDEPFMGGLTIAEYDALSEEEKDALWEQLAEVDLMEMEEIDVENLENTPDAVFA